MRIAHVRIFQFSFALLGLLVLPGCGGGGGKVPPGALLEAPNNLSATPGEGAATLRWQDNSKTETAFELERRVGGEPYANLATLPVDATSYVDDALVTGSTYSYRVRAANANGVSSYSRESRYRAELVTADSGEPQVLESGADQLVIVPGLLKHAATVGLTASEEPSSDYDYLVVGSTVRVLIEKASIDLASSEPLFIVIPPSDDYAVGVDRATTALVRLKTLIGEYVETFEIYSVYSREFPIEISMALLNDIEANEGLPDLVEIEITPLDLAQYTQGGLEAAAVGSSRRRPLVEYLEGLYRLDVPAKGLDWGAIAAECKGDGRVSSFDTVERLFGASSASASQAAWTADQGKVPLVLVHGWQGFSFVRALNLKEKQVSMAPALCGWVSVIRKYTEDEELRDRVAIYVFGYDSARIRIGTNAIVFKNELGKAFGTEPVYVVGHSMGGNVGHAALQAGASIQHLYTLGTPFRGSSVLECRKPTDDGKLCDEVSVTLGELGESYETGTHERILGGALLRGVAGLPGTKDLAFEEPFSTHTAGWETQEFGNFTNNYLHVLNVKALRGGLLRARYTAFFGNIEFVKENGKAQLDDSRPGFDDYAYHYKLLGHRIYDSNQQRFNDGLVAVESATFLPLTPSRTYDELGNLSRASPLGEVIYSPCTDHGEYKDERAMLGAPTGSDCASAPVTTVGTIFDRINRDLKNLKGAETPPTITSFTTNPSGITTGGSSTLSWRVTGTQPITLTIDPGIGDVTGHSSITVNPTASTTYTLTASNSAGEDSATAKVTLTETPPSGNPLPAWVRQLGTDGNDLGRGVAVDANGNAYITGTTTGSLNGSNAGQSDVYLAKYDSRGNQQWIRQLGSRDTDHGYGVAVDGNGNAYITGTTTGSLNGSNAGQSDVFLAKYDSNGTQQWIRQFGSSDSDEGWGVAVDGNGNAYINGRTLGSLDGSNDAGWDAFLAKYDSDGNLQWTRQLLADWVHEYGLGVAVDGNGAAYITGYTLGNRNDVFLAKYDSDGTQQWIRQFGSSQVDVGVGVAVDGNGSAYIAGLTEGYLNGRNAESSDAFLAKYDTDGTQQWIRQFGSSQLEAGNAVTVDRNGNPYITGYTYGILNTSNAGGKDVFLAKYDSDGNQQWIHQLGSDGDDDGRGVAVDGNGNAYIVGDTLGSLNGGNAGYSDVFLAKYMP